MSKRRLPARLRRQEGFFGIHFDFHADAQCDQIGNTVTRRMINQIIDLVKPDYIQCDCKGHAGFSSYPTKVGNAAPGFARDQLRIWREVTAQRGVTLVMHYSGVWDRQAITNHPEWARLDAEGKSDGMNTSVFGPADPCRSTKSAQQLQREAANVLALGGGFQVYDKQNPDGSIQPWQVPIMAQVARFCRQRRRTCHRSQTVPQVGLHYCSNCYYRDAPNLFAPGDHEGGILFPMRGTLQCLLDGQASVDVLMDHHMRQKME